MATRAPNTPVTAAYREIHVHLSWAECAVYGVSLSVTDVVRDRLAARYPDAVVTVDLARPGREHLYRVFRQDGTEGHGGDSDVERDVGSVVHQAWCTVPWTSHVSR